MNTRTVGVALVAIVVAMVVATAAFAAGTGERPADVEPGRRLTEDTVEVTVTGTVEFRDGYPVLITDDGAVSLSARRGGLYATDTVEGMELTVTGERIAALDSSPSGADYHIFVASAEADGETIAFDRAGGRGTGIAARDGSGAGRGVSVGRGASAGRGSSADSPGRGGRR